MHAWIGCIRRQIFVLSLNRVNPALFDPFLHESFAKICWFSILNSDNRCLNLFVFFYFGLDYFQVPPIKRHSSLKDTSNEMRWSFESMRCPVPLHFPWHELQDADGQAANPGQEEGDVSSVAWQEVSPASRRMQEGTWTPGGLQNLSASLSLCVTDKHTGSQPHIWMRNTPYHLKSKSSIPKSLLSYLRQWLNYLWQQPERDVIITENSP